MSVILMKDAAKARKITVFQNTIYFSDADLLRCLLSLMSSVCSVFHLFHFSKDGKRDDNK
jgi:hypothetical protein